MEIDAKFRRELTKRFEMESHKREAEITENWRKDLDAIFLRKGARRHGLFSYGHQGAAGAYEYQGKDAHEHYQR